MKSKWLKICGLQSVEDAFFCIDSNIDAIGILIGKTRLAETQDDILSWENAKQIAGIAADTKTTPFLLCHIRDVEKLIEAVRYINPVSLQIQFSYDPEIVATLKRQFPDKNICQTVRVTADLQADHLKSRIRTIAKDANVDFILADSPVGGSGQTYNWNVLSASVDAATKRRLIVAGGINAQNILEAKHMINPFGFDVMTGARISRGVLDRAKVQKIIDQLSMQH